MMAMGMGLLLFSCAPTHENAEQVDRLPNMYPDYSYVTIPGKQHVQFAIPCILESKTDLMAELAQKISLLLRSFQ